MLDFEKIAAVVADDHELFRAALAELLRKEFRMKAVFECSSHDETVEHLGNHDNIRLACLDLSMPGMSGAASLHEMRDVYPDLRVVVITGSERREDILASLGAGVHGFIPKTFRVNEIASALKTVLRGGIFVPPCLAEPSAVCAKPLGEPSAAQSIKTATLSPRQKDVMELMALGKSNKEIARALDLAEGTVKVHVHALYRALGTHNRVAAVTTMARTLSGANFGGLLPN